MAQRNNTQSGQIIEIYNSRKHIIDLLEAQKYDVSQYNNFSINDVNTLFHTIQMDMLLRKTSEDKKIYVKYHLI